MHGLWAGHPTVLGFLYSFVMQNEFPNPRKPRKAIVQWMDWKQSRFDLQYSHLDPTLWDLQGSMAGIE